MDFYCEVCDYNWASHVNGKDHRRRWNNLQVANPPQRTTQQPVTVVHFDEDYPATSHQTFTHEPRPVSTQQQPAPQRPTTVAACPPVAPQRQQLQRQQQPAPQQSQRQQQPIAACPQWLNSHQTEDGRQSLQDPPWSHVGLRRL